MMKTDIEIAQEAELKPITEVAELLDMTMDDLELYGKYKAKISDEYLKKIEKNEDGKLILVTAINPTPVSYTHLDVYKRQMYDRVLFVERSGELRMLARLSTEGAEPKGNHV